MKNVTVGVNDLATTHPHLLPEWADDSITPGTGLHVHHIKPRKFGIDDNFNNLITLCVEHHQTQPAHYWSKWTPEFLPFYQLEAYKRELMSD